MLLIFSTEVRGRRGLSWDFWKVAENLELWLKVVSLQCRKGHKRVNVKSTWAAFHLPNSSNKTHKGYFDLYLCLNSSLVKCNYSIFHSKGTLGKLLIPVKYYSAIWWEWWKISTKKSIVSKLLRLYAVISILVLLNSSVLDSAILQGNCSNKLVATLTKIKL